LDLRVNASRVTATEYMCTKFGVDGASHFPFRLWTHTQTHPHKLTNATDHAILWTGYAGMG